MAPEDAIELAVLRRLGPPAFAKGRPDRQRRIERLYCAASARVPEDLGAQEARSGPRRGGRRRGLRARFPATRRSPTSPGWPKGRGSSTGT
jgi:hypothetical protein